MDIVVQQDLLYPRFGAKRAGIIFLITIVALILLDILVVRALHYIPDMAGSPSLWQTPDQKEAARRVLLTLANPIVTLLVGFVSLKRFFPAVPLVLISEWFGMGRSLPIKKTIVAFCCGAVYVAVFMVLLRLFPPSEMTLPHPDNVINSAPLTQKIIFVIAVCTVVPVAEEFLFRGILYQGISHSWGKAASALCVSLMFIAMHPDSLGSGYWLTHMALYLFPFVLVLLREVAGSLYAPIAAHSGFNFTEVFF